MKKIIPALLIVCALALGAIGAVLYLNNQNQEKDLELAHTDLAYAAFALEHYAESQDSSILSQATNLMYSAYTRLPDGDFRISIKALCDALIANSKNLHGNESALIHALNRSDASSINLIINKLNTTTLNKELSANIDWDDDDLFAIAYLDYQPSFNSISTKFNDYIDEYFGENSKLPLTNYNGNGDEYYLFIPRYEDLELKVYAYEMTEDDFERTELLYTISGDKAFVINSNISDIFPSIDIEFTYEHKAQTFAPYMSLRDGYLGEFDFVKDISKYEF